MPWAPEAVGGEAQPDPSDADGSESTLAVSPESDAAFSPVVVVSVHRVVVSDVSVAVGVLVVESWPSVAVGGRRIRRSGRSA